MDIVTGPAIARRSFLRRAGALGAALATAPLPALPSLDGAPVSSPLRHIVVACQENRSFDHYFGFYPRAGRFGVPADYSQPNGKGGTVKPHHLQSTSTNDIDHTWLAIHRAWDRGRMRGFYTTDGALSMGYYNAHELGYYYSLAERFTLCGNFFSSLLGPTAPNRLYLASGTSGGNTTNSIPNGSLHWPTILDLLDAAGISFKVYNGFGGILGGLNPFTFFARWVNDPRVNRSEAEYFSDLQHGTLPQFAFIVPSLIACEHPPVSISWGLSYIKDRIDALIRSPFWQHAAFILTYDEGGGFFDHVRPPQFDAYGAGIRIPALVVSPFATPGHISPTVYDHSSILKLVEAVFHLPSLASTNHRFDTQTPGHNNEAARGAATGPAAPPRDGQPGTGNMLDLFTL